MKVAVVVLALLAAVLGAVAGFAGGHVVAVISKVRTDMQLACALLQTAENTGYLTRAQRGQLVDGVVPPAKGGAPRADADRIRAFAEAWWENIREDQKSGCPDV